MSRSSSVRRARRSVPAALLLLMVMWMQGCAVKTRDAESFGARGNASMARREYDQAIADYDEAIRLEPTSSIAYNNRGGAWSAKNQYKKAIADYNEAIRLDPMNTIAYYGRGVARLVTSDHDQAIADFDAAIRLDPSYALARVNRGNAWCAKHEFDKAIADYSAVIRLEPANARAYGNRGLAWFLKRDFDTAIADFGESIRLAPRDADTYYNRGLGWTAKKEYDKAIADFGQSIRIDPKHAPAIFSQAAVQMILRRTGTVAGFKTVVDLQGRTGELSTYAVVLAHLAAQQEGKPAEAKAILDAATAKLDVNSWKYRVVRMLRGEIDERSLLAAAADDDQRSQARSIVGLDLESKGRTDRALDHFRWVRDHGNPASIASMIAVAGLDRLEKPEAKPPTDER